MFEGGGGGGVSVLGWGLWGGGGVFIELVMRINSVEDCNLGDVHFLYFLNE